MMFDVGREDLKHCLKLIISHRFDHVFTVMAEEEETSTLTSAFTRLEDLLAISLWRKTLLKQLDVKIVQLKELSKLVQSMVCNIRLCCNLLIFGDRLHQF